MIDSEAETSRIQEAYQRACAYIGQMVLECQMYQQRLAGLQQANAAQAETINRLAGEQMVRDERIAKLEHELWGQDAPA